MKYVNQLIKWTEEQMPDKIMSVVLSIVAALLVIYIGLKLIKLLLRLTNRNLHRMNLDEGVIKFLLSIFKILLYILLVMIAARIMGLETSGVVALIGSAGLAIGLSLQGSLSNFAGGVLILTAKPFLIGETIIVGDMEGIVTDIDIIYTTLLTFDNRKIVLPNGKLANSDIINVTHNPERRLDLTISIEYSENIKKVKEIIKKLLEGHDMVLPDRSVDIFISSFEASSVCIGFRVWTKTENYWQLRCNLMEEVKEVFDENGINIPYEQMKIEIMKE